jgi:hypothetical protein
MRENRSDSHSSGSLLANNWVRVHALAHTHTFFRVNAAVSGWDRAGRAGGRAAASSDEEV